MGELFEGKLLRGERNGKGKEYDDFGGLIFEGEFINGKKNGKGKEYYSVIIKKMNLLPINYSKLKY